MVVAGLASNPRGQISAESWRSRSATPCQLQVRRALTITKLRPTIGTIPLRLVRDHQLRSHQALLCSKAHRAVLRLISFSYDPTIVAVGTAHERGHVGSNVILDDA